ncbi:hypothetical protein UE98_12065 [Burkholderia cenocepacia]|nr:hypothetical protein UE98_12065 [Burkholderia cenocepacia]
MYSLAVRRLCGNRYRGEQRVQPLFDLFDVIVHDPANEDLTTKLRYRNASLVCLSAIELVGGSIETKGDTLGFAFAGMT